MNQPANMQAIDTAAKQFDREEHARRERDRSNGVYYSLEWDTAYVEKHASNPYGLPEREFLRKYARKILYEALSSLTPSQAVRIYRHFFDNQSYSRIARSEGVDESAVRRSVERGLVRMREKVAGTGISQSDFAAPQKVRYIKHRRKKQQSVVDRQKSTASLINFKEDEGGEQDGGQKRKAD